MRTSLGGRLAVASASASASAFVLCLIGAVPTYAVPAANGACDFRGSVEVVDGMAYTCTQGSGGNVWSAGMPFGVGKPCLTPGTTALVSDTRYACSDVRVWQVASSQPNPAPAPPDSGGSSGQNPSGSTGIPSDSSFKPSQFTQDKAWQFGPVILDSRTTGFTFADAEAVTLKDGRVRLYVPSGELGKADILSFISRNGQTFTQEPGVRLARAGFPSLLKLKDGSWRMYYTSQDEIGSVRSAVSKDGLTWTVEPGVRAPGQEPSAATLKDGRILLSVRRTLDTPAGPGFSCNKTPSVIDFYVSSNGVDFSKVREAVNGQTYPGLDGRAMGNELTRLKNGQLGMLFEGCFPMFWAPVNEKSLQLGRPKVQNLRGAATVARYGDAQAGGAGGDPTHVVQAGRDRVYMAVRSPDGRDRLVTATRR